MGIAPKFLVIAPLFVLSTIFMFLIVVVANGENFTSTQASSLLIGGFSAYAAALALTCRIGLRNVADLQKLGLTDSLSMLPNRRAVHPNIKHYLAKRQEVAVALIDLDGFKTINDLYGHAVGDQVIIRAAERLKIACGEEAVAYRLGGDEFAISMGGPLAATILEGICRKFLTALEEPIAVEDRRIPIGASVGLSHTTETVQLESSELLRRADVAMYASKRGGKMRCTWFKSEFDLDLEAMRDMDTDLRHALAHDEFAVHYQPLVDAQTGTIVAVESLIRWTRPNGPPIGPDVFIPIAEQSGLINPIGLFVLRRSCMDARDWAGIKLSVNISAAQLRNPEFPMQLGQILEETGFDPERLELEITETCLVLDPVVAERSLDLIRTFGVDVVLDDFGAGYASIGFLRQFRFQKLKIDRSLIVGSAQDAGSRAMMLSSITMAQALKMSVTAEGVETHAQADLVRSAGCHQIQGWLYYKAMPCDEVERHFSVKTTVDARPPGSPAIAKQTDNHNDDDPVTMPRKAIP
ncbi:MAG: EAL domain-containing protein [Pontixanthobacter sp.]